MLTQAAMETVRASPTCTGAAVCLRSEKFSDQSRFILLNEFSNMGAENCDIPWVVGWLKFYFLHLQLFLNTTTQMTLNNL